MMEVETVAEILRPLPNLGAVRVKFPHKRAFIAWLHKIDGIPVSVESETMNIPLSALAGVVSLERAEKAFPEHWKR